MVVCKLLLVISVNTLVRHSRFLLDRVLCCSAARSVGCYDREELEVAVSSCCFFFQHAFLFCFQRNIDALLSP